MNPDDLARILDDLGKRLGPTGEYVFALAVRQVYINAITAAIVGIVLTLLTMWAVPRLNRWRTAPDADDMNGRDMVLIIGGVFWGLVLAVAGVGVVIAVPRILNPEYAAIRDILGAIGAGR